MKRIHLEININQIVGIILGWLIVRYLFPLFNHLDQSTVASISTVIFFVSSYARSFLLRLYFEKRKPMK
jgi:hypothetical protein